MNNAELAQVAQALGTPLYIFDDRVLQKRVAYLASFMPENVKLCYAVKANTFIIPLLKESVASFEICSTGEARICQEAGVNPAMMVISGVNKDVDFMEELISTQPDVHRYTVESRLQFDQLRALAAKHDVRIPLLLRLTSGNQFGLDKAQLKAIVADFADDAYVDLVGIQYFSGTQKMSTKRLARELRSVAKMRDALQQEFGFECREIEFGTGFPVQYFDDEPFDEDAFLAEFAQMLRDFPFEGPITLEIGRSIAASCGTFLTSVVDAKTNAGQNYAIVDGGMNHLVYFGQSLAMRQPQCGLLGAEERQAAGVPMQPWNICGSLCSANDILAKQLELPGLRVGDILAFHNTGAYCMTEGISLFLSRDLPQVALIDGAGEVHLVRQAVPTYPLNGCR